MFFNAWVPIKHGFINCCNPLVVQVEKYVQLVLRGKTCIVGVDTGYDNVFSSRRLRGLDGIYVNILKKPKTA